VRDCKTRSLRARAGGLGAGGSSTRDWRTRRLAWHGASRTTVEHLGAACRRLVLSYGLWTGKEQFFVPKFGKLVVSRTIPVVDEMKHGHLTLPSFCHLERKTFQVCWSQADPFGNLERKQPGKLPRFQHVAIACSMQPYRLGLIRA